MIYYLWVLIALLFWHFLADYPLQGDFLARAKNHRNPIPTVPWWQALAAHSFIHAAGVAFITGSLLLGLAEFIIHAAVDYLKSEDEIGFNLDQAIHVLWKALFALVVVMGGAL